MIVRGRAGTGWRPVEARRLLAAFVAFVALVSLVTVPVAFSATPAAAADTPVPAGLTETALTLPGRGDFLDLRVTVSKTEELSNEAVAISWSGGRPTSPAEGKFYTDYLQVMQCWGSPGANGPERDQCQFGASDDLRGGYGSQLRRVFRSDAAETFPEQNTGAFYSVPVRSVNGVTEQPSALNGERVSFFSRQNSNEIAYSRTNPAGAGEVFLEAQTALEAPWMGCGAAVTSTDGGTNPRRCYAVVVPRGRVDADGTVVTNPSEGADGALLSSPMSASNWDDRIVFPLDFAPVDTRCTGTAAEIPLLGTEVVTSAFRRWQPTLCNSSAARYSYVEVADIVAENSISGGGGEMVFTTSAFDSSLFVEPTDVEYAPVTLSGVGVAVLVEQVVGKAPEDLTDDDLRRIGTRVQTLNLTPRLVAKLLTQSYQGGAWLGAPQVADNPRDMSRDPEFRELNPAFSDLSFVEPFLLGDALTPASSGGAVRALWRWVMADPSARAWLDGAPDEDGMRVNPAYRNLEAGLDFFPRRDMNCLEPGPSQPNVPDGVELCALDLHPYTSDLQASARYASRGDLNASVFNTGYLPGQLTPYRNSALEPALSGRRAALAITDTVSAARYQLPMASLRNAGGQFVAPTPAALITALGGMSPSAADAQVFDFDPSKDVAGAYPVPVLAYAALVPADTTPATAAVYADAIEYAVGDGQTVGEQVGDLPRGYAPLPTLLRRAAVSSAAAMQARAGIRAVPSPTASPAPTVAPESTSASSVVAGLAPEGAFPPAMGLGVPPLFAGPLPGVLPPLGPAGAVPPGADAAPAATALANPPVVELAATRTKTGAADATAYRYLVAIVLGIALIATVAGPLTMTLARRKRPGTT